MSASIPSAATFTELLRRFSPSAPVLTCELANAARQLDLSPEAREALARLGSRQALTVRDFLGREELQRELGGVIEAPALLKAFKAWLAQQILSLHQPKRELVDALLAGTEAAGKLTTEQLAALIRGPGG